MISFTEDSKAFTATARSRVDAFREELLKEAAAQFGSRFPTAQVSNNHGHKKTVPVDEVVAAFEYLDASGLPHIYLRGRVNDPWTGDPRTVFLADLGRGF
jgi:hypothetical protein